MHTDLKGHNTDYILYACVKLRIIKKYVCFNGQNIQGHIKNGNKYSRLFIFVADSGRTPQQYWDNCTVLWRPGILIHANEYKTSINIVKLVDFTYIRVNAD